MDPELIPIGFPRCKAGIHPVLEDSLLPNIMHPHMYTHTHIHAQWNL